VDRVATLVNASPESVGFLASPAYRNELLATRAAAVVLTEVDHNARRGEALEKRVAEFEAKVNKNDE
jgi:UDP-3-O-[3-hydroxymyristoyl] glucosamine N-acyltransferase